MFSSKVVANTPATAQQYNRLREDARGASALLGHESTTPNMTVVVESGFFISSAGANVVYAGGSQVIGAVGAQPRWDLLSINTSGTLVLTVGTASGSPVKPTLPATNFPVCYIYLRVGGTSIKSEDDATNHYIQDARLLFSNPTDVETLATLGTKLFTAVGKTTPVDADGFSIFDSAASNALKTLTFTNLKAFLKTYFDTLYTVASSLTVSGIVELATTAEIDTGTDSTRAMPVDQFVASNRNVRFFDIYAVENARDNAVGTNIAGAIECPFTGTITEIGAYVETAGVTGTSVWDVNKNGTTIMTTNKLSIDSAEVSTRTAATVPTLTTTAISAGDLISIDTDSLSTTKPKGLHVRIGIRLT